MLINGGHFRPGRARHICRCHSVLIHFRMWMKQTKWDVWAILNNQQTVGWDLYIHPITYYPHLYIFGWCIMYLCGSVPWKCGVVRIKYPQIPTFIWRAVEDLVYCFPIVAHVYCTVYSCYRDEVFLFSEQRVLVFSLTSPVCHQLFVTLNERSVS
jgi:hypothetical protein